MSKVIKEQSKGLHQEYAAWVVRWRRIRRRTNAVATYIHELRLILEEEFA